MTMNKIIERLARNAADFLLDGDTAKSNACMELLGFIKANGLDDVRGRLTTA
jgi:hypothetical protein